MKFSPSTTHKKDIPLYSNSLSKEKFDKKIDQAIKKKLKDSDLVNIETLEPSQPSHFFISKTDFTKKSPLEVRRFYGRLAKDLASHKKATLALHDFSNENLRSALVGLADGAYTFDRYRKHETPHLDEAFLSTKSDKAALNEAKVLSESIKLCRDLINTPAEDMGPDEFEKEIRKQAKGSGLKIKVMSESDCKKAKMGALLAVGRASHRKSRLLILEWSGSKSSPKKTKDFLALCGKGVCFDTGGLNIKPDRSMLLMKKDMGGAATVASAMLAFAKLKVASKIKAYIPLVENAVGPDAFRPGDVLTASDGTTIEVGHTDAEGRLALADAIAQAKRDKAKKIVTVATLTGAAMVALGRIHVPIMGDQKLVDSLKAGAESSGEKVWQLPMDEEHRKIISGCIAELTNSDGSGEAGCITAGSFLAHFAGDTPFAHCDISPASWKTSPHDLGPIGATGVLVSTLVDAFRSKF